MDTTLKYIKMSEMAAKDLQSILKWKKNSYVWDKRLQEVAFGEIDPDNTVANFWGMYADSVQCAKDIPKDLIWLPTQDDLQDMVKRDIPQNLVKDFNEFAVYGEGNALYTIKYTSMEQLWIAFVMLEKYNKIWNIKNWEVAK